MDLSGKVAIVTGAARGLGRGYVGCLAAAGAAVIAADQRDCSQTVTEVEAAGGRALGLDLDVADSQSTQAMADAAVDAFVESSPTKPSKLSHRVRRCKKTSRRATSQEQYCIWPPTQAGLLPAKQSWWTAVPSYSEENSHYKANIVFPLMNKKW